MPRPETAGAEGDAVLELEQWVRAVAESVCQDALKLGMAAFATP
jgi:hypothetical protein